MGGIGAGPARSPSHWRFKTTPQHGKIYGYPRGTGLGGSVSHHVLIDGRGLPSVYNEWAELTGDPTWRFENLVPIFKEMENYDVPGADESVHGKEGWLHIKHGKLEEGYHDEFIRSTTANLDVSFRTDLYDDPKNLYGIYRTDTQMHNDGRRSYVATDLILPTYERTKEQGWNNF